MERATGQHVSSKVRHDLTLALASGVEQGLSQIAMKGFGSKVVSIG